jgi:hypothetical protein
MLDPLLLKPNEIIRHYWKPRLGNVDDSSIEAIYIVVENDTEGKATQLKLIGHNSNVYVIGTIYSMIYTWFEVNTESEYWEYVNVDES